MRNFLKILKSSVFILLLILIIPIAIDLFLLLIPPLIVSSCPESKFNANAPLFFEIKKSVEEICGRIDGQSDTIILNLTDLTSFEWDIVYFSMPYQPRRHFIAEFGLDWDLLACTRSPHYDEWTQIIFASQGEVAVFFDIPTHGYFSDKEMRSGKDGIVKDNAKFLIGCTNNVAIDSD